MLFTQSTEIQDKRDNVVLPFHFGTNAGGGVIINQGGQSANSDIMRKRTEIIESWGNGFMTVLDNVDSHYDANTKRIVRAKWFDKRFDNHSFKEFEGLDDIEDYDFDSDDIEDYEFNMTSRSQEALKHIANTLNVKEKPVGIYKCPESIVTKLKVNILPPGWKQQLGADGKFYYYQDGDAAVSKIPSELYSQGTYNLPVILKEHSRQGILREHENDAYDRITDKFFSCKKGESLVMSKMPLEISDENGSANICICYKIFCMVVNGKPIVYSLHEHCEGKTLLSSNHNYFRKWPLVFKDKILKQLLLAVMFLHKNGIFHGDIKPDNVMVDTKTSKLKLIDFDTARTDNTFKFEGSPGYIPPEYFSFDDEKKDILNNFKKDIFVLGAMMYEMYMNTEDGLFTVPNGDKLIRGKEIYDNYLKEKISREHPMAKIILKCLAYEPSERPTIYDLIEEFNKIMKKNRRFRSLIR